MLRVMTKLFAFLPSVESISEHTLSTYCMPSIGSSDVYFISVNTHKSSERTLFPPPPPPARENSLRCKECLVRIRVQCVICRAGTLSQTY